MVVRRHPAPRRAVRPLVRRVRCWRGGGRLLRTERCREQNSECECAGRPATWARAERPAVGERSDAV